MVLSLIQGALGNPFGSAVSGTAFGVLNEVLSDRSMMVVLQDHHDMK